jgi:hypothetical protein
LHIFIIILKIKILNIYQFYFLKKLNLFLKKFNKDNTFKPIDLKKQLLITELYGCIRIN